MSKATDKNLREVHENAEAIVAWVNDDDRDGFDHDKLRYALTECVSEFESYVDPEKVRRTKATQRDAADTIAYIREILEK